MENPNKKKEKAPHPRETANPCSALTFAWLLGTFLKGFKRDLEVDDLYETLKEHRSDRLGDIFEKTWEKEVLKAKKKGRSPSFLWVIVRVFFWRNIFYSAIMAVTELAIRLIQPFFIGLLVEYFSVSNQNRPLPGENDPTYFRRCIEILREPKSQITKSEAIFYASGIVLISLINVFVAHPYMMAILHQSMKIRVASCSLIYRKALRLSRTALGETTVGQVVNLLSNDVNRFDVALIFLHYLWIAPVETIIVTYFMYEVVGWATFLGVLFLLMLIPLQGLLGKKMSMYRLRTAFRTDERVRLMNEIINGIQVIKMYTWEFPFAALVSKARAKEMREIKGSAYGRGILLSFIIFSTRCSIFLTLVAYALSGDTVITAEKIFVLASFYNILRQTMTVFFPAGITQLAEALISVKRIQDFMLFEENVQTIRFSKDDNLVNGLTPKSPSIEVRFENVTAKWKVDHQEPTLNNVTTTVPPNRLIALIGPIGSGKSSFLQAILKELPPQTGNVIVNGSISYASQEPWLFVGSIRQNILFGQEYNKQRYQQVVQVCALKRDFELLPYGDKTLIGERGISLSGGQRARINLARAVYKEADIYLLDDPLSAVDTHVGKHLFDDCIAGYLKTKTVILATHQLQYLRSVDNILIFSNGRIEAEGSFKELQKSGLDFAKLLQATDGFRDQLEKQESESSVPTRRSSVTSELSVVTDECPKEVQEQKSKGSVGFKMAQDEEMNQNKTIEEIEKSRYENIYIYSVVSVSTIAVTLCRSFLFFYVCALASKNLHDQMFTNIICAPMRFFHTNPSGRILNRFSKDIGAVDELLPATMIDCYQIFMALFGIVLVVAIVSPVLLVPTCIIGIFFYFIRIFYVKTSRAIKRLEAVTRSPVFSHLNATLQGLPTIRAFRAQSILIKEFDAHQDLNSTSNYIFMSSSRAFGLWLDVLCVFYIGIVTFSFLYWDISSGANAGLAITQSIALTGMFQWGMRQSAEMENQMTSVERVMEYRTLEKEPPLESKPEKKPPVTWPAKGEIEFDKTYLRYDPLGQPVLHGISVHVFPREKIGIVGRTGAGKSTLIAALFRLAYIEGKIIIDSVETSEIGLHDLRSKISIIPQEPVLFSGTLRYNLDPFDEHPDWVLWQALHEVELKEVIEEHQEGLSSKMSEGGSNFSVGQRQLLCLARAIIRNNKILIMDEATANVDPQTDRLIQKTIRKKFNECTVLTIAHRLNTVMDSDRILVVDAGNIVEFDHPYLLLKQPNSVLKGMVSETGPENAKLLFKVAKKSHKLKLRREEALKILLKSNSWDSLSSDSSSDFEPSTTTNKNNETTHKNK
ncbi:hypothetical protein RUM43_000800 [Polyplax serrata]|uniref:Uncharacterized protein n=1 Tax=Polyplax serrata TaxID=468196 RepID=A0AAN8SCW8_POLSC